MSGMGLLGLPLPHAHRVDHVDHNSPIETETHMATCLPDQCSSDLLIPPEMILKNKAFFSHFMYETDKIFFCHKL